MRIKRHEQTEGSSEEGVDAHTHTHLRYQHSETVWSEIRTVVTDHVISFSSCDDERIIEVIQFVFLPTIPDVLFQFFIL